MGGRRRRRRRRLAVPKDPRFGPLPFEIGPNLHDILRTEKVVPHTFRSQFSKKNVAYFDSLWDTGSWRARILAHNSGPHLFKVVLGRFF